jgi:hypothetical protein
MHSEQLNELAAVLVAAQAEFETVSKDSTNPVYSRRLALKCVDPSESSLFRVSLGASSERFRFRRLNYSTGSLDIERAAWGTLSALCPLRARPAFCNYCVCTYARIGVVG